MSKKRCSSCACLSWCHDWYMYNIGESSDEPNARDCDKYLSQYKYKVTCNTNGFEILEKGALRPIAYQLSGWDSKTEVFYKCANCGQDFRLLGQLEKYCHSCGKKQNWKGFVKYCSKDFSDLYFGISGKAVFIRQQELMAHFDPKTGDIKRGEGFVVC